MSEPAAVPSIRMVRAAAPTQQAAASSSSSVDSLDYRPQTVSIAGYAGDTLTFRITVTDLSLVAGATWSAQVRPKRDGDLSASFTIDATTPGVAILTLSAADTAALGGGYKGVWDAQITKSGAVRTLVQGDITLDADVTRTP